MPISVPFDEVLSEYLLDTERAMGFLNAALENYDAQDKLSQKTFILCLRSVAEAQGKMDIFTEIVGTEEEEIKTFGNPHLGNFIKIVDTLLGFETTVQVVHKNTSA